MNGTRERTDVQGRLDDAGFVLLRYGKKTDWKIRRRGERRMLALIRFDADTMTYAGRVRGSDNRYRTVACGSFTDATAAALDELDA
jgi:hypothetical protein